MSSMFKSALLAVTLLTVPALAQAGTLEGVAIGAGSGALIAGPPGAVVGGVIGGIVGGPNLVRPRHARGHRTCWRDRHGVRHCAWR
jgi:osmotically inducible lipoprotein OsmB